MTTNSVFFGIDVGRSAVKGVAYSGNNRWEVLFPTAVSKTTAVTFAVSQATERDTVMLNGENYWTGETSQIQHMGATAVGTSDAWVATDEHDVLVLSAINRLVAEGAPYDPQFTVVTLGVPSRVFKDRRDLVKTVKERASSYLTVSGVSPAIEVQAQPMGVIGSIALNGDGSSNTANSIDARSFAVVEVGQATTDFTAVIRGNVVVESTTSCEGVAMVISSVSQGLAARPSPITLPESAAQSLLVTRSLQVYGKALPMGDEIDAAVRDVLMPRIMAQFNEAFNKQTLQFVDQILVAGGGAPIVFPEISKLFPHAVLVEKSRFAVADGLAKLGALLKSAGNA